MKPLRSPQANTRSRITLAVLLIALAARILRAATEPIVNPDVIRFIDMAKALFSDPNVFRHESYHPLHAILGRIFHDLFTVHLIADDRFAWIWAFKIIGILAGTGITWLIIRTSRHLGAPWWAAAGAGLLWAVGRRPSSYGADGLSDTLFLFFFGCAILVAIRHRLRPGNHWMAVGALSGLAYLTRPEGVAVILILGLTLLMMVLRARVRSTLFSSLTPPRFALVKPVLLMLAGFLILAAPYMLAIGRFTAKKEIFVPVAAFTPCSLPLAQIHLDSLLSPSTWERIGKELWETFGFAACLIVLLAMPLKPKLWGRVHWRPLVLIWVFLWLAVMLWLIDRTRTPEEPDGYLDGRHTLVLQFILHCLFALALDVWKRPMIWWQSFWRRRPLWATLPAILRSPRWPYVFASGALVLALLPGTIMLSEPPSQDRQYLRDAAAWIQQNTAPDAVIAFREQTLGFYANRQPFYWPGKNTEVELKHQKYTNPYKERLLLACIFQRERGEIPPDRLGECTAIKSFESPTSLHGDILVLYLPDKSTALK